MFVTTNKYSSELNHTFKEAENLRLKQVLQKPRGKGK